MIGYLQGTVRETEPNHTLIDTGGVGYLVYATSHTLAECVPESQTSLYIHTVVREQALDLYGFSQRREKELFELLIAISGIGPKVALAILNATVPSTLIQAVLNQDSSILTKVSGIGKKNAEKIILELHNKIDDSWRSEGENENYDLEVFEALESLGYRPKHIQEVLKSESLKELNTSEKIRQAIKLLS